MRKTGIVNSCEGEIAKVSVIRSSSCGENCAMCKGGCKPGATVISARNAAGAMIGDRVILEIGSGKALSAAAIVYVLPLVLMLGAALAAFALNAGDTIAALCALTAFCVGFLASYLINKLFGKSFDVTVTKVINKEASVS